VIAACNPNVREKLLNGLAHNDVIRDLPKTTHPIGFRTAGVIVFLVVTRLGCRDPEWDWNGSNMTTLADEIGKHPVFFSLL